MYSNTSSSNILFVSRIFGGSAKYCYLCAAFRRLDLELNPSRRRLIEFLLFNALSHAFLLDCIAQAQNCPKRASIVEGCYLVLVYIA